ncbi:hypothetical protein U1769_16845 [Sphingomonas sp. ZT3P38]|uniref:hypothetical protein n=1 Tax=Parasphingomonas zepuensis TaxID=3096161 RepID=UPI002FC7F072
MTYFRTVTATFVEDHKAGKATTVSTRELLCWVVAFFATATICIILRKALDGTPLARLAFNAVDIIAWGSALILILRHGTARVATTCQIYAVLATFACAMFLPGRFVMLALLPIGLMLTIASGWSQGQRRAGAVFVAIGLQPLIGRVIPVLFGDIILKLDTAAAGIVMQFFLPGSSWYQDLLKPPQGVGVTVMMGCSSFANLSYVMLCFTSLYLLDGGRPSWRGAAALLGVSLVVFAANTARLIGIATSLESYQYWHDGSGAQIFAIVVTALTIGLCSILSRWASA